MENPIKMDDLGVPLFSETPKYDFEIACKKPCDILGEQILGRQGFDIYFATDQWGAIWNPRILRRKEGCVELDPWNFSHVEVSKAWKIG